MTVKEFHHPVWAIFLTAALAGCAHTPLAQVSGRATVGPVTGAVVNLGPATRELVPEVKIVKETCAPPPALLIKHDPLPLIAQRKLTLPQIVNLWIDDEGRYADLNVDHSALIDWLSKNCQ